MVRFQSPRMGRSTPEPIQWPGPARRTGIAIGAISRLGKPAEAWNSPTSLSPPLCGIASGAPSGENAVKCISLRPGLPGVAVTSTLS